MKSSIYEGNVYHRRFGQREHVLNYSVFYLLIDLDELDHVDRISRLLGINRRAWFSFFDADHGNDGTEPLREWCERTLRESGIDDSAAGLQVLTTPRVFSYVFNPISVIYCRRADDSLGAMIYEVNNTFGERIAYVVPVSGRGDRIHQRCDKSMFVSPFYALAGHYEFELTQPGASVDIAIDYHADDARQLRAVFRGQRKPLDRRHLAALARRHPAASLKIMAGIHFEALKLWLKGVPLVRHRKANTKLSIGTEL